MADSLSGGTGYQEAYQEVAGSLVKIKVTVRILVAGDLGRCPREPTISCETWSKGRGGLSICRTSTGCSRDFPTAPVAMRTTVRIRIRCISWSAGIEDMVANNAGSRIDSAELWEPRLENCLAHGEIKMLLRIRTLLFKHESRFSALLRPESLETVDRSVQHRLSLSIVWSGWSALPSGSCT